jgi:hypothetical protein
MANATSAVSPLRRRMIDDMTLRNLSPATQRSYLNAMIKFARHFNRSPDQLGLEDVRAHSETSGRLFRQHPVSHSGVSGHLRIVAAKAWFLMSGRETFVNFFCCLDRAAH